MSTVPVRQISLVRGGVAVPASWDLPVSPCWAGRGTLHLLALVVEHSAVSEPAASICPTSRKLAGEGGSSAAAVLWAGVVLLPLRTRQLITTEPLMLALRSPGAKDKHCYYVTE